MLTTIISKKQIEKTTQHSIIGEEIQKNLLELIKNDYIPFKEAKKFLRTLEEIQATLATAIKYLYETNDEDFIHYISNKGILTKTNNEIITMIDIYLRTKKVERKTLIKQIERERKRIQEITEKTIQFMTDIENIITTEKGYTGIKNTPFLKLLLAIKV